jgi:hypothetical protein
MMALDLQPHTQLQVTKTTDTADNPTGVRIWAINSSGIVWRTATDLPAAVFKHNTPGDHRVVQ